MTLDPSGKSTRKLPDAYLIEDLIILIQSDVSAPKISENEIRPYLNVEWQSRMIQNGRHTFPGYLLKKEKLEDDDVITWSTVNGVYPLFPDKAATAS